MQPGKKKVGCVSGSAGTEENKSLMDRESLREKQCGEKSRKPMQSGSLTKGKGSVEVSNKNSMIGEPQTW